MVGRMQSKKVKLKQGSVTLQLRGESGSLEVSQRL